MPRIIDGIWLLVLAAVCSLWYADRSLLSDHLRTAKAGVQIEKHHAASLEFRLLEATRRLMD